MSQYSVGTIIALGLISVVFCQPIDKYDGKGVLFRMFGILTLENHVMKFCGNDLTRILSETCRKTDGYNKRSHNIFNSGDFDTEPDLIRQMSPSISGSPNDLVLETQTLLLNMLSNYPDRFNRKARNASHDCCSKGCTLHSLQSYCYKAEPQDIPNLTRDNNPSTD